MKKIVVSLNGGPLVGKGRAGRNIREIEPGAEIFSMGEALRDVVKTGTTLGKEIEGYMKLGELVPDRIYMEVLTNHLRSLFLGSAPVVVLDGVIRDLKQAMKFQDIFCQYREGKVFKQIVLNVPKNICFERFKQSKAGRDLTRANRVDDLDEQVFEHRWNIFQNLTVPAIHHLQMNHVPTRALEGNEAADQIFKIKDFLVAA